MPRKAPTEAECARYLRAVRRAGYESARVVIAPDGTVSVIAGVGESAEPVKGVNDFDTLIRRVKPDAPPS